MAEEVKKSTDLELNPSGKKSIFGKLKDAADDHEGQMELLSTFVRLGILIWSGGILTLAYIKLPPALGIPEQKLDPTFIASVFTGVLATFGVQTAKKNGDTPNRGNAQNGLTKEDIENIIKASSQKDCEKKTEKNNGEPPVMPTI